MKTRLRIEQYLLAFALAISCYAMVGCEYFPESSFDLASESRLPRWITIPPGDTRADVSITMSYYDSLWGSDVKVVVHDRNRQISATVYGKERDGGPINLKSAPQGTPAGYPAYVVITVNGITEIIEHRKMEPIFYITDDPIVWHELMGVQSPVG